MAERKVMKRCFICGEKFQMGPHQYELHYIRRYDIYVCRIDYDGNWDGWEPDYGDRIIEHLKKKGISIPEKNDKGLLPRD